MQKRWRWVLVAAVAAAALALLIRMRLTLAPFFLALVIAYLLHPLVEAVQRRGMSRPAAILVAYSVCTVALVLTYYLVVPPLLHELDTVAAELPRQARRLQTLTQAMVRDLRRLPVPATLQHVVDEGLARGEAWLADWADRLAELLLGFFSGLYVLVLAPFLAYYMLRDAEQMCHKAVDLIPARWQADALQLARRIDQVVGGFLRGQLLVSAIIGGLVAVGLALLKVKYALLLGLVAGLFDLIPYFGPIVGSIPAVLLAFLQSPATALYTVALILLVHQVEATLLSPRILSQNVGLHPLAVVFAVLAGGELAGFTGMLLAVPIAGVLRVLGEFILQKWARPLLP